MKLTTQQGQRLTTMMLAMRPDWTPNKPENVLIRANEGPGFPAANFGHCIRALANYATETNPDGTFVKRTPNLYPEHGRHWTSTASEEHQAPDAPKCQEHDTEPAHNCRSCLADVKVGDRHPSMIGKSMRPANTPGRSPRPDSTRRTTSNTHAVKSNRQLQHENPALTDLSAQNLVSDTIPQSNPASPPVAATGASGGTL